MKKLTDQEKLRQQTEKEAKLSPRAELKKLGSNKPKNVNKGKQCKQ